MRTDDHVKKTNPGDTENLGNFGDSTPRNSFSGGETDHLFLSDKGKQFYDVDAISGLADGGDGRTFCTLDYDRDGWVDFVVSSATAPSIQLHRNRIGDAVGDKNRYVAVRVVGGNRAAEAGSGWSARNAYGTLLSFDVGAEPLVREVRCGEGRSSLNSRTILVGIGARERVDRLDVRWPSGRTTSLENVVAGTLVTAFENAAETTDGSGFESERYQRDVRTETLAAAQSHEKAGIDLPKTHRLSVVTAMSTHCASCKKLQPQVASLRDAFDQSELGLYGVGTDLEEDEGALSAYAAKSAPAYLVLSAAPLTQRTWLRDFVRTTFQDDITPVSLVLDESGAVLATMTGIPTVSKIRELQKKLASHL